MIRKEFILFMLLFSFFSLASCDKERNDPKEGLGSRWEAVEFSYDMPADPTTGKIEKHTWPFSSLTQGCAVDFIKLDGVKATLYVSEPNENNSCETKIKSGKVEGNAIIFEGEENRPRTILARNAKFLKLRYRADYEKYPKMDFDVLYKNTDPNIKDELPSDKSAYVGTWVAKDYVAKDPKSGYTSNYDVAMIMPDDCANAANDLLTIKDDKTVEFIFFRRGSCSRTVYTGKIDGDIIAFDEDKDNPRKIVKFDGMFLSVKYKEPKQPENFVMRFEKK